MGKSLESNLLIGSQETSVSSKNIYNSKPFFSVMPTKDLSEVKNKIISFLENNGPSLPAAIARHIQTDMIFASAFLSELYSEKRLKITKMKVGSSPVYYLSGQEEKLQSFAHEFLKSKEKDAFERLKEKKILKDSEQEPAIRVALRAITDFAFPKEREGIIYWKYFLENETPLPENPKEQEREKQVQEDSTEDKNKSESPSQKKEETEEKDKIKEESKEKTEKKKNSPKKKKTKKKSTSTKDEKFFNNVKEYLKSQNREIEDIINFNKNELILKIKENEEEKIVIAFNKKRVTEADITKVYKKISEFGLEYYILSLGEPAKKTENLIEAIQKLDKFEKFE